MAAPNGGLASPAPVACRSGLSFMGKVLRPPSCSPVMRPAASRRTSPSCRSCCGEPLARDRRMPPALKRAVMPRIPAGPRQPSLNLSVISSADDLWLGLGEWNTHMGKFEQYRRNAEEAQRQADRATSEEIRTAWLQLVQGWLALLPKQGLSREQVFDVSG
jgi:hypothetical protein